MISPDTRKDVCSSFLVTMLNQLLYRFDCKLFSRCTENGNRRSVTCNCPMSAFTV
jgi:hypothetical protein